MSGQGAACGAQSRFWSSGSAARRVPGAVGIWHETYVVERAEPVCGGMPPTGLARATSTVPVGRNVDRAAARLAGGQTRRSLS